MIFKFFGQHKHFGYHPSSNPSVTLQLQRQDSLANSIQNILGDVSAVQNVIGRDPNMWLGTTRPPPTSRHNSHKNTGERSNDRREGVVFTRIRLLLHY